jgi:hypothetical protein
MTTTNLPERPQLAPEVFATLAALRVRVRAYIWAEGLTLAATWLGGAFWASLAVDWFFEPPRAFRLVLLGATLLGLGTVLFWTIGRRAFMPLQPSNMATLLERRFSFLDDSLLTAVLLTTRSIDPDKCNPAMLAQTCRVAQQRIGGVRLGQVFNYKPLRQSVTAAGLLALSIFLFAFFLPDQLGIWARRNLGLAEEPWPRLSGLRIGPPFDENGVAKVARGADLTVVVEADPAFPRIPDFIEIRSRTRGGARTFYSMTREETRDPQSGAPVYRYLYTFQTILQTIRFDVVDPAACGGRLRDLEIRVVEPPRLTEVAVECVYPAYMVRAPRTLPVTGVMQFPRGTRLAIHARANKQLAEVRVDASRGEQLDPVKVLTAELLDYQGQGFTYQVGELLSDTTLLFTLSDTDGLKGREPERLALAAVADEPPQLNVRMDGIDAAITPNARIPFIGQIVDDHGVGRVWAETVGEGRDASAHTLVVPNPQQPPIEMALRDLALEVEEMALSPGEKLVLCVKAADLHDLESKGPNIGTSERWLLEVVTPDRLRRMLEARELVLRQRFEVILSEVTDTRDLLLKVNFRAPADAAATEPTTPKNAPAEEKNASAGSDPEDAPQKEEKDLSSAEHLNVQTLRVQRAIQYSRKNAHETSSVAESFEEIAKQLVNNRIDTPELRIRIEEGIAKPLRQIAEDLFPLFERRLEQLQQRLGDPVSGPELRLRARQQADDLLIAMQHVLSRMLELEDYNKAVELLRLIIEMQKGVNEETQKRYEELIKELQK